jgi:hypothetical protein
MDNTTILVLFAMFSLTLIVLTIFARVETAIAAMKVLEKLVSNILKQF